MTSAMFLLGLGGFLNVAQLLRGGVASNDWRPGQFALFQVIKGDGSLWKISKFYLALSFQSIGACRQGVCRL